MTIGDSENRTEQPSKRELEDVTNPAIDPAHVPDYEPTGAAMQELAPLRKLVGKLQNIKIMAENCDVAGMVETPQKEWTPYQGKILAYDYCITELKSQIPEIEKAIAEHIRLEVAAALREAANIVVGGCADPTSARNSILALIPPADRSALDRHDAEVYRQGIEQGLATRMEAIERVKAEVREQAKKAGRSR